MFCHFQISIAGAPAQKVVFQLHSDKCPKACENFKALCQSQATAKRPGSKAMAGDTANFQPTYRGTEFHRILPNFMIQGGDFTNFDGTGGHAVVGNAQGMFEDENFDISHDREGILSMANKGKNTNGSQFFITLGKALHLDGKHVAFGNVVKGMEVVREASKVETDDRGRPGMMQRVVIVDCGLNTGDDKSDASSIISSSSSYSSAEKKRKRSSSKKKKKRRRGDDDDASKKKKKRKRSRETSEHSKHRKRHDKDRYHDRHGKSCKEKLSHRDSRRNYSSSSEDENKRSSSKKRHRHDKYDEDDNSRGKKKY